MHDRSRVAMPGPAPRWRIADAREDDALVELCRELYREDPGALAETAPRTRETLAALRSEPWRGRAVVLEVEGRLVGYALLVAFWSNHLGGEVCEVDELFVASGFRSRGHGAALFRELARGGDLWPGPAVAIALGITPTNARARRLYERLGFVEVGVSMVRLGGPSSSAGPGPTSRHIGARGAPSSGG